MSCPSGCPGSNMAIINPPSNSMRKSPFLKRFAGRSLLAGLVILVGLSMVSHNSTKERKRLGEEATRRAEVERDNRLAEEERQRQLKIAEAERQRQLKAADDKREVQLVMEKRNAAFANFPDKTTPKEFSKALRAAYNKLVFIDLSRCPSDFQQVFVHYREVYGGVVRRSEEEQSNGYFARSMAQLFIDSLMLQPTKTGQVESEKNAKMVDELGQATADLEGVAQKY